LDNTVGDYNLLKSRPNISLIAYFLSRVGALGYMLGSAIFSSAPTGNCVVFEHAVEAWCPLNVACTGYLFFLRLRAVYNRNRIIVGTFFVLWLGLMVSSLFVPIGVMGGAVGPTDYCEDALVSKAVYFVQMGPFIYDTLVFVAISWRLSRIAYIEQAGPRESLQVVLFGKYLPAFTKSMLLDGQIYYLTTSVGGIAIAILSFSPGIPGPLRTIAMDPYIVLGNIMACRVYRRTRMGLIRESEISTTTIDKKTIHPIAINSSSENSLDTASPRVKTINPSTSADAEKIFTLV